MASGFFSFSPSTLLGDARCPKSGTGLLMYFTALSENKDCLYHVPLLEILELLLHSTALTYNCRS